MNVVLTAANTLLPLLYLLVFGAYVWIFRSDSPTPRRWATPLAGLVVVLHLAAEAARAAAYHRLPMGSKLEFASALALALLLMYLFVERRLHVKSTGFLATGLAFVLQFIASAFSVDVPASDPLLSDPGYAGHAVLVLLSYTALALSFVYAVLYLVLARQLGRHQFGLLFRRLPSLEMLERMSVGAVELGVPLMFASLCLGHLWMYSLADRVDPAMAAQLSPYDPKILVSWVIFLGYSAGLIGYRFLGWRGRRMNVLAVSAFVVVIVAMGLVRHFAPSFHDFRQHQAAEAPAAQESRLDVPSAGGDA